MTNDLPFCPTLQSGFHKDIWEILEFLCIQALGGLQGSWEDVGYQTMWASFHISHLPLAIANVAPEVTAASRNPQASCVVSGKEGSWWLILAGEMGC